MAFNPQNEKMAKIIGFVKIFASYTIIAIILTWPSILNLKIPMGPAEDNQQMVWNFWWFKKSIFELHTNPFYCNYIFFPEGTSLLFHSLSPFNCVLAIILGELGSLEIAYNILILLSFPLAACSMYYFARWLGIAPAGSFLSGILFSFNSYHFVRAAHHLNLCSYYLIPIAVLFVLRAIEKNEFRYAIAGSLILALNLYIDQSIFIIAFLTIFLTVLFIGKNKKTIITIFSFTVIFFAPLLFPMIYESIGKGVPPLGGGASIRRILLISLPLPIAGGILN